VFHWGKFAGAGMGYILGGMPGIAFGLALGFLVDKSVLALKQPQFARVDPAEISQLQKEFFVATFAVMGHVSAAATAGGNDEMQALDKVMARLNMPADVYDEAVALYNQGTSPDFNLNEVLLTFLGACRQQPHLLEMFMEIQLFAAYNGANLNPTRQQILLNICRMLEMSRTDFDRIFSTIRAEYHFSRDKRTGKVVNMVDSRNVDEAYAILNLSPNASNDEIKQAYRRLTSMHHPDKLVAKGLPEEMLKIAEDKTREIRLAYDRIRELRNF
jgi:DnaJ like chaperone protein